MLGYGIFGVVAAIVAMVLGVFLFVTEPSLVRWLGVVAIFGGLVVALRSWVALSIYAEEVLGRQPAWHIQRVLTARR